MTSPIIQEIVESFTFMAKYQGGNHVFTCYKLFVILFMDLKMVEVESF